MNRTSIRNSIFLLLAAIIWGGAFVAQSVGMDYVGPFTFNGIRNIIGSAVLVPVVILMNIHRTKTGFVPTDDKGQKLTKKQYRKNTMIGGILCGCCLCAASTFQQIGIIHAAAGKAGFITALYVVIVPVLGLFLHKRVSLLTWFSVGLSLIGLFLLCMPGQRGTFLQSEDIMLLLCALLFSIHIIVIDHFTVKADGVAMSCIQFLTCGMISLVIMLFCESPSWNGIMQALGSILYAGILSCGVAYTLQIVGQKGVNPTVASLILCLESVVSALAGWALLGEKLSAPELTGCMLMFGAIVLAQLPMPGKQSQEN